MFQHLAPDGLGDKHLGRIPEKIETVQLVEMDQRPGVANNNLGEALSLCHAGPNSRLP